MNLAENGKSASTRARLIEAAGPVFARTGFRAATVQEICKRAGANIAAVNYHFRDKLGLYRAVLRSAESSAGDRSAIGTGNLTPEQRLGSFIRALLNHLFGEGPTSWFAQVIAHEMAEPTPVLKELIERETRPGFERLKKIVAEILDLRSDDERVMLCANSVVGQCLHYFHSRPVVAELWPQLSMTPERIEQIADHITAFSFSGLAQVKKRQGFEGKKMAAREQRGATKGREKYRA